MEEIYIDTICSCTTKCAHFVEPMEDCIYRLPGDIRTQKCETCDSFTWHQDSTCLRCSAIAENRWPKGRRIEEAAIDELRYELVSGECKDESKN
jgi:hypothetical protein